MAINQLLAAIQSSGINPQSAMAPPISVEPSMPNQINGIGDAIAFARAQDPFLTLFTDSAAKKKQAAALMNETANMAPPKMPEFPVRPGEAGLLGLGAVIASALGAPSADINAFVGNYLGAKGGAQKSVFEQQMLQHQQRQQAKQFEAKTMLDSAQSDEERAKFLATQQERKDLAAERAAAAKNHEKEVAIGKLLDSMNSKMKDKYGNIIPVPISQVERAVAAIKAINPEYFLDPATKMDTSGDLLAKHQATIDAFDAEDIYNKNIDTALNKTGTDRWQRVAAASNIQQALNDPKYGPILRRIMNPEALARVGEEASWEGYRKSLSDKAKAYIDRMSKLTGIDDLKLKEEAIKLRILEKYGMKDAAQKLETADANQRLVEAKIKEINDGKSKLGDKGGLTPGNITSAVRGNEEVIGKLLSAKATIIKSASYSHDMGGPNGTKTVTEQGAEVDYLQSKIDEYEAMNTELRKLQKDVFTAAVSAGKDQKPKTVDPVLLRKQSIEAINKGADPAAVKARYKQITGKDW